MRWNIKMPLDAKAGWCESLRSSTGATAPTRNSACQNETFKTQVHPAHCLLNSRKPCARVGVGHLSFVPASVNSRCGSFLFKAGVGAFLRTMSVELYRRSGLDGNKLPKGRHDAPISRPCRTRQQHGDRVSGKGSVMTARQLRPSVPQGKVLGRWVYRLTATRLQQLVRGWKPKRIPQFIPKGETDKNKTLLTTGSLCFQPLSSITRKV